LRFAGAALERKHRSSRRRTTRVGQQGDGETLAVTRPGIKTRNLLRPAIEACPMRTRDIPGSEWRPGTVENAWSPHASAWSLAVAVQKGRHDFAGGRGRSAQPGVSVDAQSRAHRAAV